MNKDERGRTMGIYEWGWRINYEETGMKRNKYEKGRKMENIRKMNEVK